MEGNVIYKKQKQETVLLCYLAASQRTAVLWT